MVSSMAASSSAGIGTLATLLHESGFAAFSGALALSPGSPQAPDSSAHTALRIAPASSAELAGPPFDSRRLHFQVEQLYRIARVVTGGRSVVISRAAFPRQN